MLRGENKQIAINILAQIGAFAIQYCISFFLTPFIVKTLGVEAYGFVSLSSNIIGYMQVATIALNSMASRFISMAYHRGDLYKVNRYFSSVFYANCIISLIISIVCLFMAVYLEYIINIPQALISDVKCLFILLTVNTIINLIFNVYTVSSFIKNRLELTSIRDLVSSVLRMSILLFLFGVFAPRVSYLGIASVLATIYLVAANITIKRKLTPELHLSIKNFDWKSIRELLSSGVWNLLINVGIMLEKGFDLLLANWFINYSVMGLFSVVSTITIIIPRVVKTGSFSFAPTIIKYGANGNIEGLERNILKSIKMMSIMVILPLSVLYVYGENFFSLWLPDQNSFILYAITILTTIDLIIGMPLEICWTIFTATNKVKLPAIVILSTGVLTFLTLIVLLPIFDTTIAQMICLASARTFWNIIKYLIFLPIYCSKCLDFKFNYFYKIIAKPIAGIIFALLVCQIYRFIIVPNTWVMFIFSSIIVCFTASVIGSLFILRKEDIKYIALKIHLIKS